MLSIFNQKSASGFDDLSWTGRRELQLAALFRTITQDAREDVKDHPWKYPGYALYLTAMCLPSPVPHGSVMVAALVGWARLGWTPGARVLNDRLRGAFNRQAMLKDYAGFIEYHEFPEHFGVRSAALAWDTFKCNAKDFGQATRYAARAVGRVFSGKKPAGPGV